MTDSERLARIEGKMDALALRFDNFRVAVEGRVSRLEVKAALWALAQVDFGFAVGTISVKGWPRWQTFQGEDKMPEEQLAGGRWSFSVRYEWLPSEIAREALEELHITEKIKTYAPQGGVNITYP